MTKEASVSRAQFGVYTKKLRVQAKLSQVEVAAKLGFKSGQIVSNWERGACYPPAESLNELAKLYQVSLKHLFDEYWVHQKEDSWKKVRSR